ncbi:MAG: DUF4870 domain-containing protein [Paenisporosarcina sp.]
MENNRILSALCYFSILFAPFLLPIIVYFVSTDVGVKYHAKRSLLSHLLPIGLIVIAIIFMIIGAFSSMSYDGMNPGFGIVSTGMPILFMIIYMVVSLLILIWNIIQGVKVLQKV